MTDSEILGQIEDLKTRRGALILAHNYQVGPVQAMADFTGDSLELSRRAADNDAEVIVFCGVHFMAETAAILSPEKTVLLPVMDAGCPMADMVTGAQVRALREANPGAAVVCYVNSSAEVKAESDCCCTSSNAVAVLNTLGADREVIFVPDRNLGQHATEAAGQRLIEWEGYCPIHEDITPADVRAARQAHPDALLLVHPECRRAVRDAADHLLSTGQMCRFAAASPCAEFIVGTETGILHRLRTENPGKRFHPVREAAVCEDMKKIGLEDVLVSLQTMQHRVTVPADVARRARRAIDRMLAVG